MYSRLKRWKEGRNSTSRTKSVATRIGRVRENGLCLEGYYSILLLSYSISSGAIGSPSLLLSYSVIALALHNTIILI